MIVTVAAHTGWPLDYIGRLQYRRLLYLVWELDYQRRREVYRIEYRIGQVLGVLTSDKLHKHSATEFVGDAPEKVEVIVNMTQDNKGADVVMGDGKTYHLPVIDANIMEAIEEEFDKSWVELFEKPRTKVLKAIVFYLLKAGYPNLKREDVGALLTVKAQSNVSKVIKTLI